MEVRLYRAPDNRRSGRGVNDVPVVSLLRTAQLWRQTL